MTDIQPPIFKTAVVAWKDTFRAIGAMPVVAGIALALALVTSLVSHAIIPDPIALAESPWLSVVQIGTSIVQAVLLAPLAIAVHRFVLLGERANRYSLDPGSSRYLRFVGFAILVDMIWSFPDLSKNFSLSFKDHPTLATTLNVVLFVVLTITIIIITVRRAILFPAIAIDAPGATWSKAGLDTKGSSWSVVGIFVLTAVPVVLIAVPLCLLFLMEQMSTRSWLVFSVISPIFTVPVLCAYAAAASHIYRARADASNAPHDHRL